MDERQNLDTLTREEKTATRALAQLTEKQQGLEEKMNTRSDDLATQTAKKDEVSVQYHVVGFLSLKQPSRIVG